MDLLYLTNLHVINFLSFFHSRKSIQLNIIEIEFKDIMFEVMYDSINIFISRKNF